MGLSEEETSQRIAEALVHEYCENVLRNSHRIAVVAELLVSPEWGVVQVPARVMSQLGNLLPLSLSQPPLFLASFPPRHIIFLSLNSLIIKNLLA